MRAIDRARRFLRQGASVARARWYLRTATGLPATVRVYGRPVVKNKGSLLVGDRVRLVSDVARLELDVGAGAALRIGERTYINYGTSVSAMQSVAIGPDCNIGTHCLVLDNDFHRLEPDRRHERPPSRPVTIGANVWLGARVVVLPGVTIGDDSVIAAGSIVTSDVPPRSLAAGSPARLVRTL